MKHSFTLAIHGGAGSLKDDLSEKKVFAFEKALKDSLFCGYRMLKEAGLAVAAVEAAVKCLEDCPLFNAGKGAVLTKDKCIELDASIMEGEKLKAGSVAFITNVKNPVSLARAVMERSSHVMLAGPGAEKFAKEVGLPLVDPSYFFTPERCEEWIRLKYRKSEDIELGTVGAVARDGMSHLTAATSTGGMTNKKFGRIGDSPIIGAGVYANDNTCAVSSTGHGEYFIRLNAAYDVSALMEYKHLSLEEASSEVIRKIVNLGGSGGLIAVNKQGKVSMPFSTETMFRGFIKEDGIPHIAIFGT